MGREDEPDINCYRQLTGPAHHREIRVTATEFAIDESSGSGRTERQIREECEIVLTYPAAFDQLEDIRVVMHRCRHDVVRNQSFKLRPGISDGGERLFDAGGTCGCGVPSPGRAKAPDAI